MVKEISKGKLKDDFAVGIIDKDKKNLNYIRDEFTEEIKHSNLILLKHRTKQHYIIQLAPAIEVWIQNVADESGIKIQEFGLPSEMMLLRKYTKNRLVERDENLRSLCKNLVSGNSETMRTLIKWLNYLFEYNRNADINKLKYNV